MKHFGKHFDILSALLSASLCDIAFFNYTNDTKTCAELVEVSHKNLKALCL